MECDGKENIHFSLRSCLNLVSGIYYEPFFHQSRLFLSFVPVGTGRKKAAEWWEKGHKKTGELNSNSFLTQSTIMAFKFENLKVWQRALNFTAEIHELTRTFPKEELYILTSQIKRAADSIVLNIAEGSTGQTDPEFSRFLGYAIRSGIEVVSCLFIGRKRGLISEADFGKYYLEAEQIIKMTQGLRKSLDK